MSVPFITASSYTDIGDRTTQCGVVRQALQAVVNALPTQIRPEDRATLIDAISADLADREGSAWTSWPTDVYLLALTALKHLGRNPVGSQSLFHDANLRTLLHHTALPFPSPSSPFSHPPPGRDSPHALEALRILGNLLIIHPTSRSRVAAAGTPKAIARALASRSGDGDCLDEEEDSVDRVFLLARVGFLVSVGQQDCVKVMVDKEDIVDSLAYWLTAVPPIPANFDCIAELCKLTHAVVSTYPALGADDKIAEKLEPILWPTLALFHSLPFSDHTQPLPAVLYILLVLPWNERTLPTWHSVPADPASPNSGAASGVKSLLNRLSNMSNISGTSSSSGTHTKTPDGHGTVSGSSFGGTSGATLAPPQGRTSSPPSGKAAKRVLALPSKRESPTALPAKVVKVLEGWLQRWLPDATHPDTLGENGPRVDEQVPPILMLLVTAAAGSAPIRQYLKNYLLPADLDRSSEGGPLEKRKTLLGHLLRFMGCTTWINSKIAAGELLFETCGRDASVFSAEIGYGNAAGYLLTQGITVPPPGVVQEITDEAPTQVGPSSDARATASSSSVQPRNPITAIRDEATPDPTADWTDEQKEAEADRLFAVFDEMDRNPVISAQGPNGEQRGVKDALRDKYMEVDVGWADKERREQEEEDERDEREALREMEAYKKRVGRG